MERSVRRNRLTTEKDADGNVASTVSDDVIRNDDGNWEHNPTADDDGDAGDNPANIDNGGDDGEGDGAGDGDEPHVPGPIINPPLD